MSILIHDLDACQVDLRIECLDQMALVNDDFRVGKTGLDDIPPYNGRNIPAFTG